MIDHVDPIPFLVVLALLVAVWLFIGIRDRRRSNELARLAVERHRYLRDAGACAAMWPEADAWRWCTRPYEHTGPHLDHVNGGIRRRHESFIGGPGIDVHVV